jgi:voltage-gated potassium channel
MQVTARSNPWRKIRASWRDTLLLLREFRTPLFLFIFLVVVSGCLYYVLSQNTMTPISGVTEGIYGSLTLIFLQPIFPFPQVWYLQIFYFFLPVLGIGCLAQGLADFGVLFFNRRARGKEWQMAVASTISKHIVLVGLGHLGYRVILKLRELEQDVVVIELSPRIDLSSHIQKIDVPLIQDDATREDVLTAAGIQRAKTIMLCTQNDSLNLEVALKARKLNPNIEVVVRIFDDDFAASLQQQFGFHALSATGMAAPIFAANAANIDITPPITIEGQPHVLARLILSPSSHLIDLSIQDIEEKFHASLVLLQRDGKAFFHPDGEMSTRSGDSIAVFATPDHINLIVHENK